MDPIVQISLITVSGPILLTLLNGAQLYFKERRDNRRQDQIAARTAETAGRAEAAATLASQHAHEALTAINENTELTKQIEVQGNSNMAALVVATRLAADLVGEKRGLAAGRAENTKGENS